MFAVSIGAHQPNRRQVEQIREQAQPRVVGQSLGGARDPLDVRLGRRLQGRLQQLAAGSEREVGAKPLVLSSSSAWVTARRWRASVSRASGGRPSPSASASKARTARRDSLERIVRLAVGEQGAGEVAVGFEDRVDGVQLAGKKTAALRVVVGGFDCGQRGPRRGQARARRSGVVRTTMGRKGKDTQAQMRAPPRPVEVTQEEPRLDLAGAQGRLHRRRHGVEQQIVLERLGAEQLERPPGLGRGRAVGGGTGSAARTAAA